VRYRVAGGTPAIVLGWYNVIYSAPFLVVLYAAVENG
jgi:hypothetical protein